MSTSMGSPCPNATDLYIDAEANGKGSNKKKIVKPMNEKLTHCSNK